MPSTEKAPPPPPKIVISDGAGGGQEASTETTPPEQQQAADKISNKEKGEILERWERWQKQQQVREEYHAWLEECVYGDRLEILAEAERKGE
jgi:hypothetical protein